MVIVTLAQRLVILVPLRRIVTLAHWRDSRVNRTIAPVSQQTYHIPLMTLHLNRVVTVLRIHTC
jgi:hypothetical protein